MVVSGPGSLSGLGEGWRAEGVWDSELEVVSAGPGRDTGGDGESPRVGRLQMSNKGSEVRIDLLNILRVRRLAQPRLAQCHMLFSPFGCSPVRGLTDPFVSWHSMG